MVVDRVVRACVGDRQPDDQGHPVERLKHSVDLRDVVAGPAPVVGPELDHGSVAEVAVVGRDDPQPLGSGAVDMGVEVHRPPVAEIALHPLLRTQHHRVAQEVDAGRDRHGRGGRSQPPCQPTVIAHVHRPGGGAPIDLHRPRRAEQLQAGRLLLNRRRQSAAQVPVGDPAVGRREGGDAGRRGAGVEGHVAHALARSARRSQGRDDQAATEVQHVARTMGSAGACLTRRHRDRRCSCPLRSQRRPARMRRWRSGRLRPAPPPPGGA